jgi:outer membrane efflux protein
VKVCAIPQLYEALRSLTESLPSVAIPKPEDRAEAEIIPTSTMAIPEGEQIPPTAELMEQGLHNRGELEESRIDLATALNIPLRNRRAQANHIRSQLEYRQAQVRLQQLENQIRIEVRNAQFTLPQNLAAVEAAQAAVDYARQSLYAEQRKLQAGISTPTLVLQQESMMTTAQSNLISAMAAYEKSRLERTVPPACCWNTPISRLRTHKRGRSQPCPKRRT